jgi:cystathionine gamma-lyase
MRNTRPAFETRAVHAGQQPDPATGAVTVPIYATSTYAQESPGLNKGYAYGRTRNPTRDALEHCIADLEEGTRGFAFASGLAAIGTVLECLDQGAHVVATDDLYRGTVRLIEHVRGRSAGIALTLVDMSDPAAIENATCAGTRTTVHSGRELGWRGQPDRAPRDHDARLHLTGTTAQAGDFGRPRPPISRPGARR